MEIKMHYFYGMIN